MAMVFSKPPAVEQPELILPLEPGDHLDRQTFHARYAAMPPGIKAELIDGVVYIPSPVDPPHASWLARVMGWLEVYRAFTPGVEAFDNATVWFRDGDELQPDACLLLAPEAGGQSVVEEECIQGAPELVIEIGASSVSYDLHAKKSSYEAAGVREYVVVLTRQQSVGWFSNRNGRFEALWPQEEGVFRSEVFPGLWLDAHALLRKDSAGIQAMLRQGLESSPHQEFVQRLAAAQSGKE